MCTSRIEVTLLRRTDGQSLVEVMVAILVLVVGLMGLLTGYITSSKLSLISQRQATMSHLADRDRTDRGDQLRRHRPEREPRDVDGPREPRLLRHQRRESLLRLGSQRRHDGDARHRPRQRGGRARPDLERGRSQWIDGRLRDLEYRPQRDERNVDGPGMRSGLPEQ
jgi:hypothetical protein